MSASPPADRRIVYGVAVGAIVLVALLIGIYVARHNAPTVPGATAAPHGELQVRMGALGSGKLDPKAPLRCFVGGRFVGEMPLADCAAKNGVEAGRMGVGVDATGQVAAAGAGTTLAPLPEARPDSDTADAAEPAAPRAAGPTAECLRYGAGGWRTAGVGLTLRACARTLFEDRCVRPGDAVYGRFGNRTLRLVPGRVEVSPNNRDFSPLMDQDPDACTLDG